MYFLLLCPKKNIQADSLTILTKVGINVQINVKICVCVCVWCQEMGQDSEIRLVLVSTGTVIPVFINVI